MVRHVGIDGIYREREEIATDSSGESPVDALCTRALDAKRIAEHMARLISPWNWRSLPSIVPPVPETGNESTIRRAMKLHERSLFGLGGLQTSLAALNRSGLIEPLSQQDVEIARNPDTLTAKLTIAIRERGLDTHTHGSELAA